MPLFQAPALAQIAPATADGQAAKATAGAAAQVDEVVVTATRRETKLNSVPLSIQALSAQSLAEQGSYDFNSYARSVTGLSALDRGPGQQLITIRGVSSDTSSTNTDAPESKETTAIYLDETPISLNAFNPDLQLVDIDRIEVLKGPQGTLFGAGSLAGVIRIISRKPDLTRFGGEAELETSGYDGGGVNGAGHLAVNVPLVTDKAALRVVGYGRSDGGFIDNVGLGGVGGATPKVDKDANSSATSGLRAQLRLVPTDYLDVNAKYVAQWTHLDGSQNVDDSTLADGSHNPELPNGVTLGPYQQYRAAPEPYNDAIQILSLDATVHLPIADLISSTSYTVRRQNNAIDFTGALPVLFGVGPLSHPGLLLNRTRARDVVQEVRLVSRDTGAPFQWIVGVFFDDSHKSFQQDLPSTGIDADNDGAFGSDNLLHTVAVFHDRQYAVFGEANYRLGNLTATAGLRYYDFKEVYGEVGDGAALAGPLSISGRETKDNGLNPKLNLSYKLDASKLVYAQVARGFRLGGINDPLLAICSPDDAATYVDAFRSDHLWNYEGGAKLGWFGGRVQTNLSAYHIDWTDVPLTRQLACGISNTVTAGALKINGLEFDGAVRVNAIWKLAGGFGYTDSKIKSITSDVSAQTGIVPGERSAGITPWNANLTSSLGMPVGSDFTIYQDTTLQYVGSIFNYPGTFDPRRYEQKPYTMVNLRAGVRRDRWDLSVFMNNVFDKRAVLFRDRILGETRDTISRPRTIGVNVKTTF